MKNEQLTKAIAEIVADLFGCPCDYTPIDEEMCMSGLCDEICGTSQQTDSKCWKRYFKLKLEEKL